MIPPAGPEVVGDHGRLPDAQVDEGAVGDVGGDQPRDLVPAERATVGLLGRRVGGRLWVVGLLIIVRLLLFGAGIGVGTVTTVSTKIPGVTTISGSIWPASTTCVDLDDRVRCGSGHHRPEVARGLAVDEVAERCPTAGALISATSPRDRILQHVVAAVDGAPLLALGQRRADPGGAEEGADAGAGGAHPFGQVALRHDLQLDLAGRGRARRRPRSRTVAGTSR